MAPSLAFLPFSLLFVCLYSCFIAYDVFVFFFRPLDLFPDSVVARGVDKDQFATFDESVMRILMRLW